MTLRETTCRPTQPMQASWIAITPITKALACGAAVRPSSGQTSTTMPLKPSAKTGESTAPKSAPAVRQAAARSTPTRTASSRSAPPSARWPRTAARRRRSRCRRRSSRDRGGASGEPEAPASAGRGRVAIMRPDMYHARGHPSQAGYQQHGHGLEGDRDREVGRAPDEADRYEGLARKAQGSLRASATSVSLLWDCDTLGLPSRFQGRSSSW